MRVGRIEEEERSAREDKKKEKERVKKKGGGGANSGREEKKEDGDECVINSPFQSTNKTFNQVVLKLSVNIITSNTQAKPALDEHQKGLTK